MVTLYQLTTIKDLESEQSGLHTSITIDPVFATAIEAEMASFFENASDELEYFQNPYDEIVYEKAGANTVALKKLIDALCRSNKIITLENISEMLTNHIKKIICSNSPDCMLQKVNINNTLGEATSTTCWEPRYNNLLILTEDAELVAIADNITQDKNTLTENEMNTRVDTEENSTHSDADDGFSDEEFEEVLDDDGNLVKSLILSPPHTSLANTLNLDFKIPEAMASSITTTESPKSTNTDTLTDESPLSPVSPTSPTSPTSSLGSSSTFFGSKSLSLSAVMRLQGSEAFHKEYLAKSADSAKFAAALRSPEIDEQRRRQGFAQPLSDTFFKPARKDRALRNQVVYVAEKRRDNMK